MLGLVGILLLFPAVMSLSSQPPREESSERLSLWLERWSEGKIGFHKSTVNNGLLQHGDRIIPNFSSQNETCADPVRVFVPLCGKSVDLTFLAQHASVQQVVGCEGIQSAIQEFMQENPDLQMQPQAVGKHGFDTFEGKQIAMVKGDFFQLNDKVTDGKFAAVWDRASMVAIDPSLREDYVNVMQRLVQPGGKILLATLERREGTAEAVKAGPPFSIPEQEVRRLYEGRDWVESVTLLEEIDEFARNPDNSARFRDQGVTSFFELVFEIRAR